MSGYQPMYGRTDRPLPNANPVKRLSQEESLKACYDYHRRQVKDALDRTYRADPKNPEPEIWLPTQNIKDTDASFGFSISALLIVRGEDPDRAYIVHNFGGTHDTTWKPAEEVRTPVRWDYSEGMWIKLEGETK